MNPHQLEVAGNSALYGGAGAALTIFGLGLNEWAAIIAALVAVGGFCLNVWVTRERVKRERELHALTVAQLKSAATKAIDPV